MPVLHVFMATLLLWRCPCIAVERLVEYHTEPEEAAAITYPRPPASWPEAGTIEAVRLVVRYRPELPPVLKGLTFSIQANEKVGICGRTGERASAQKS